MPVKRIAPTLISDVSACKRPSTPPATVSTLCPVRGQTLNLFWREGDTGAWWPALVTDCYTCDGGGAYAAGTKMLVLWYDARPAAGWPEPHVSYARFLPHADGSSAIVESIVIEDEEVDVELAWEVAEEEVEFTAQQLLRLSEREVDDFGEEKLAAAVGEFQRLPRAMQQKMLAGEHAVVEQQRSQVGAFVAEHGARAFPARVARQLLQEEEA